MISSVYQEADCNKLLPLAVESEYKSVCVHHKPIASCFDAATTTVTSSCSKGPLCIDKCSNSSSRNVDDLCLQDIASEVALNRLSEDRFIICSICNFSTYNSVEFSQHGLSCPSSLHTNSGHHQQATADVQLDCDSQNGCRNSTSDSMNVGNRVSVLQSSPGEGYIRKCSQDRVVAEQRSPLVSRAENTADTCLYPPTKIRIKLSQTPSIIQPTVMSSNTSSALTSRQCVVETQSGAHSVVANTSNSSRSPAMSGSSEDEHMSEDGDRLIIDDSADSNAVTPTRCGNIQNRTYLCGECPFSTTSAYESLNHKVEVHKHNFAIYKCDLCHYATRYKQKLPRHKRLHFSNKTFLNTSPGMLFGSSQFEQSVSSLPSLSSKSNSPEHCCGKPLKRLAEDLNTPFSDAMTQDVHLDDGEDDCDEEDLDERCSFAQDTAETDMGDFDHSGLSMGALIGVPAKKKRKDVSPDKYFEVAEELGCTKYGCSRCGNVYKWKKSLNKHWKEKHCGDPGNKESCPPGMKILLDQGNHQQADERRCYHRHFLARITVKSETDLVTPADIRVSRQSTPEVIPESQGDVDEIDDANDVDGFISPGVPVGPFASGISQPVFPGLQIARNLNGPNIASGNVLDLSSSAGNGGVFGMVGMDETDSILDECSKPLDFSFCHRDGDKECLHSDSTPSASVTTVETSSEEEKEVSVLNQMAISNKDATLSVGKEILKCPKCSEVLKTQTAYSNHIATHLQSTNKRVTKCYQCGVHFPNNDALNTHFASQHMEIIASHKEAIQKIPHGLQQTYHLLKMPLQNIPRLSNQDSEDPLKCNMCDFTAKWPAELQKHAVSHSDERPFICMVCGSTYKWKWDLVKHFEKAHNHLPNPYKRRDNTVTTSAQISSANVMAGAEKCSSLMAEANGSIQTVGRNLSSASAYSSSGLFPSQRETVSQGEVNVLNFSGSSQQSCAAVGGRPNLLSDSTDMSMKEIPNNDKLEQTVEYSGDEQFGVRSTMSNVVDGDHHLTESSPDHYRQCVGGPGSCPVKELSKSCSVQKAPRTPYKAYKTVDGGDDDLSPDLKYQCTRCDYKARWPSEIMQHMKNHSKVKPYGCPNCTYRSKWKWDVVKHLKRCGSGGSIKDVMDFSGKNASRGGPPNVIVTASGSVAQKESEVNQAQGSILGDDGVDNCFSATNVNLSSKTDSFDTLDIARLEASPSVHDSLAQMSDLLPSERPSHGEILKREAVCSESLQDNTFDDDDDDDDEGKLCCLSCTFKASSNAELKRHQAIHSDEKPWVCECGYSTRWKCDIKKHMEKYNHHGRTRCFERKKRFCSSSRADTQVQLAKGIQRLHPERILSRKSGSELARFLCKECSFATSELVDWVNHRRLHKFRNSEVESSYYPKCLSEVDDARLKHPRKPLRKLSCGKCAFVCVSSAEYREHLFSCHNGHSCPFCEDSFPLKSSFLDHLIQMHESHFNISEWEHFFLDPDSDNEEDMNNNNNTTASEDEGKGTSVSHTASSADTHNLSDECYNKSPSVDSPGPITFPCEWCNAVFQVLPKLVRHVNASHLKEMAEYDKLDGVSGVKNCRLNFSCSGSNGEDCLAERDDAVATSDACDGHMSDFTSVLTKTVDLTSQIDSTRCNGSTSTGSLSRHGSSYLLQPMSVSAGNSEDQKEQVLDLSTKSDLGSQPFVSAPDVVHCSEPPLQTEKYDTSSYAMTAHLQQPHCWFCNNQQKSFMEVFSHMQTNHHWELMARFTEHSALMQNIVAEMKTMSNRSKPLMTTRPIFSFGNNESDVQIASESEILLKWVRPRKVLRYKGIQIVSFKTKEDLMYKCISCNLVNKNPSQVAMHSVQVHKKQPQTYRCSHCYYSCEKLQSVLQHHQTIHCDQVPDIIVAQYEEIPVPEQSTFVADKSYSRHLFKGDNCETVVQY